MKKISLPKVSFVKARKLILTVFSISIIFSLGYTLGIKGFKVERNGFNVQISRENPLDKKQIDFSLFWKVWDILTANYFDKSKLSQTNFIYGAISGMVASIGDPYTVFLPPQENKVVEEDLSGSFEGVGIQLGFKGTQLAVVAPLPDSPAEKAGIKAGDFIVGIKDEVKKIDQGTVGISLNEAVKIIRGPAGTKVTLAILRDGTGEPLVFELTRARQDVPSLILSYVGENKDIVHLKLLKFGGETNEEWEKAVLEILKNGKVNKIILDLRNNPGGYLQGAVDVAAEFLKSGSLVAIEEKADGTREEFKTQKIGLLTKVPMVVLINGGSASASEILAGALRDGRKTKIVGEKSFGKGTIQEPLQLEDWAGLHITVARWLTPSGFWVNEKGLEPDVKIEDDSKTTEDEQLNEAIKQLL